MLNDMPRLLTVAELANFIRVHPISLYRMLPKITRADGKMRAGRAWRFDAAKVRARMEAGLFGRGLDANGNPEAAVEKPKLRVVAAR
jgi:hypothetical protein